MNVLPIPGNGTPNPQLLFKPAPNCCSTWPRMRHIRQVHCKRVGFFHKAWSCICFAHPGFRHKPVCNLRTQDERISNKEHRLTISGLLKIKKQRLHPLIPLRPFKEAHALKRLRIATIHRIARERFPHLRTQDGAQMRNIFN